MAAANLLALIDDIATLLDDVSIMSKIAVKKTAGVLGDDLALNAEQVAGVKADRELPVVWAVAKGSLLNKVILVPAALLISAVLPVAITVLMVIGGLYLSYEGFEKVFHKMFFPIEGKKAHLKRLEAIANPDLNLADLEKDKIKGAIRTDFILSAEIIVIVLGTVQDAPFLNQILVLSGMALLITVGVYGLVAGIVKLDDAGLYLLKKSFSGRFNTMQRLVGRGLLQLAPMLMKSLAFIGTVAMFLVGGGILVHSVPIIHEAAHYVIGGMVRVLGSAMQTLGPIIFDGFIGLVAGALVLGLVSIAHKIRGKTA